MNNNSRISIWPFHCNALGGLIDSPTHSLASIPMMWDQRSPSLLLSPPFVVNTRPLICDVTSIRCQFVKLVSSSAKLWSTLTMWSASHHCQDNNPPRPPSTTRHLLRSKIIIILFFRSPRVCSTSSSGSSGLHTPQHSSATATAEAALLLVFFWWSLWIRPQSIFDLHRKFLLLGENDSQTSKIRFPANWLIIKIPPIPAPSSLCHCSTLSGLSARIPNLVKASGRRCNTSRYPPPQTIS